MFLVIFLCLCVSGATALAESRLWTSADGKTRVYGELVGTDGQVVYLRKRQDQQVYTVPLSLLSAADQKAVQEAHPGMFPDAGKKSQPDANGNGGMLNSPAGSNGTSPPPISGPGQPSSSPAMNSDSAQPNGASELDANGWDSVRKAFPMFNVFSIDGIPAIGRPTQRMMDTMPREQRVNLADSEHKVGVILSYLAVSDALEQLAKELPSRGFDDAVNSGSTTEEDNRGYDYSLMTAALKLFYPADVFKEYRQQLTGDTNDFEKAEIAAKAVERVAADFAKAKFSDDEVHVISFVRVNADHYDADSAEFPLRWSAQQLPPRIGDGLESVEMVYVSPAQEKLGVPATPEQAAQLAGILESDQLVLKQDLVLSAFRRTPDEGSAGVESRRANAELVAITLVPRSQPDLEIYRWEFKRTDQPGEQQPLAGQLEKKMQQLAQQHQLKMFQGYPAVRTDSHIYRDENHAGNDHRRFSTMLDRVAIGLDSAQVTPTWIARHIPEAVGTYVDSSSGRDRLNISAHWRGTNEFAKRDVESRFQNEYRKKIEAYAVDLPIRFVELYAVESGEYDFERQGFELDFNIQYNFPAFLDGTGTGNEREISQWRPTGRTQSFVPLEPAAAEALYRGQRAPMLYVKRVVTWDRVNLPMNKNSTIPSVLATSHSYELYADAMLQNRIATLEHIEAKPAYVSESELVALPGPDHPLSLNTATIDALIGETNKTKRPDEDLLKLFDRWSESGDLRREQLGKFMSSLDWTDNRLNDLALGRNPNHPEERAELTKKKELLTTVVSNELNSLGSPFLPAGMGQFYLDRVPEDSKIELARRWQTWLADCIESNERHFVVRTNIKIDPDIHDLAVTSNDPRSLSVTRESIAKGTRTEQFLVVSRINSHPNTTVCLQFQQSLAELLSDEQTLKQELLKAYSNQGSLELVFSAGEVSVGGDSEYDREVLIAATPKSYRLFDGGKLLAFGELTGPDQASSPTTENRMTESSSAASAADNPSVENAQSTEVVRRPISPATTVLMLGRYLPEMADKYCVQLMRNRYKQEIDFRSSRDQQQYGVDPSLGMYYPINTPTPEVEQLVRDSARFKEWLSVQAKQLGDNYSWRFTAQFGPFNETTSGYPLGTVALGHSEYVFKTYQSQVTLKSQLERLKQSQQSQQNNGRQGGGGGFGGGGGGGGGFGGGGGGGVMMVPGNTPTAQNNLKEQIEAKEKLLASVNNALPLIDLGEVDYHFRMEDLDGRSRTSPDSKPKGDLNGYWNPDDVRSKLPSEALYPMLSLDSQIYLPESLGIDPSGLKFEIELEFEVTEAEQQETPTASLTPELELMYQSSVPDYGRYVLFHSKVTKGWLLHPVTKERLHEIGLRRVKADKPPKS